LGHARCSEHPQANGLPRFRPAGQPCPPYRRNVPVGSLREKLAIAFDFHALANIILTELLILKPSAFASLADLGS
jgi:hypothetical protein